MVFVWKMNLVILVTGGGKLVVRSRDEYHPA